jgi:serine phosphatase RsbU (regulator of sigma subunit)
MAVLYDLTENKRSAISMYKKALTLLEIKKDIKHIANTCYNLSLPYESLGILDSANYYVDKAFKIFTEMKDYSGLASCYGSYASEANDRNDFDEAIRFYKMEIANFKLVNETSSLVIPYENIGNNYLDKKDYLNGKLYLDSAMNLAIALSSKTDIYGISKSMSDYYTEIGDYKNSNLYLKKYYDGKDSMTNDQLKTELSDMRSSFDRENSESQLKIQTLESEKNLRSKEFITWGLILSSVFFLIVIVLSVNRYRIKQKSYVELNEYKNQLVIQKEKIEENQKEIIDSINYAKRIQSAIMAKEEDILHHFPESFLFYKPKNIVAGDFYFFETTDTHIFYAAADCTGHGVPGALMSVVCANSLTRCVKEFGLTDPGEILDQTRELVLDTLKKSGKELKDGMDISFVSIKKTDKAELTTIKWAGANNPLWYISNGLLMEIDGNKQPIGYIENPMSFTTHIIELKKEDTIYLFTDGYADQFGGPKGKKYKYKQLKEKLVVLISSSLAEQKNILEHEFHLWKGDLEQVDDICIIGVRI